jgi:hypothetical protein
MYGRFLTARRLSADCATETNVGRWLKSSGFELVLHLAADLPVVLDVARCEEERAERVRHDTPAPPTIADVRKDVARRDYTYSQLCTFGLQDLFGHQVSAVLPSAPKLKQLETDNERLDVFSYLAVAVDTGDGAAIEAILKWLKGAAKRGMNELDWITILREFSVTRREIKAVLKDAGRSRSGAERWARFAGTDIGRRLAVHAFLRDELSCDGTLRTPTDLAADLVGQEEQVSPKNLKDMWKDRRRIFEGLQIPD